MASPFKNNAAIYLKAGDSPFALLVKGAFRASLVIVTAAGADATLTLFDGLDTSGGDAVTVFIGLVKTGTGSIPFTFGLDKETPFLTRIGLSATLSGAGATAFIYSA